MSRRLTNRIQRYLPAGMEDRISASLEQAGMRIAASQFLLIVVIIGFVVPVLLAAMLFISGASPRMVMIIWGALTFFGLYGARMWLGSKVKSRQKAIWKELPDAFDLVTASVEAGLGIDASLARVMEKTKGPFADELRNTMREISMGRSRRDALRALGERTGVPELQTFLNAIVQAETMGVSVGNVIRVQTGVLRTKRRQRAEEQAFKAPIKMVFPLVFFIFPSIFVIIGGPAVISLMDSL
jgi:tight adherence protein C